MTSHCHDDSVTDKYPKTIETPPPSCFVLFVVCQVDALSPSSSSISHNSSYSSVTPTSSHFIQSTFKPTDSSPRCHQLKLSVCWLNSPPYLFKDDDTGNISGAFNEAIEFLRVNVKTATLSYWCLRNGAKTQASN